MADQSPDVVADVLRKVPLPDRVRADAWDAFHQSATPDELAAKLAPMGIQPQVKAYLWDLKSNGQNQSLQTPEAPSPLDSVLSFGKGVASQLNPVEIVKGIYGAARHPWDTAVGLGEAQLEQFKKGKEAYDAGRYSEAFGHTLAGVVPLVGPQAANIGENIGSGHVAEGLGQGAGLVGAIVGPTAAARALQKVQGTAAAESVARAAQSGAEKRIVDVIAPKVGPQKQRWGTMAQKAAPTIAAEPGMGALSREGLERKVAQKLTDAEEGLDAAHEARPKGVVYDTAPIKAMLQEKVNDLSAVAAEGPEAHGQVRSMGLDIPGGLPPAGTPFRALARPYKEELRRILTEMEELRYTERTWLDKSSEVSQSGGYGTGRGSRVSRTTPSDAPFAEGGAGAPVYHEIMDGATGTSRGDMIRTLKKYIDGTGAATPIVKRAWKVADDRMRNPDAAAKAQFPLEAGYAVEDVSGPIGSNVVPGPMQPRVDVIQQAIYELDRLGPAATYDALKKIRQGYDKQAAVKYSPSITQDFLKLQPGAEGAADVTSVLRESMAMLDTEAAAANKTYSVWRKAHDVLRATADVERTRPAVGRKIVARLSGAVAGGEAGGGLGAVVGWALGPIVDGFVSSGATTQVMTARMLSDVAKALRSGDVAGVESRLKSLRKLTVPAKRIGQLSDGESEPAASEPSRPNLAIDSMSSPALEAFAKSVNTQLDRPDLSAADRAYWELQARRVHEAMLHGGK